jgi:hypothetical protein
MSHRFIQAPQSSELEAQCLCGTREMNGMLGGPGSSIDIGVLCTQLGSMGGLGKHLLMRRADLG